MKKRYWAIPKKLNKHLAKGYKVVKDKKGNPIIHDDGIMILIEKNVPKLKEPKKRIINDDINVDEKENQESEDDNSEDDNSEDDNSEVDGEE